MTWMRQEAMNGVGCISLGCEGYFGGAIQESCVIEDGGARQLKYRSLVFPQQIDACCLLLRNSDSYVRVATQ